MVDRKKICFVISSTLTAKAFLHEQLKQLTRHYDVMVVANEKDHLDLRNAGIPVDVHFVPIERRINPVGDARALWLLYRFLRSQRFDLVHSVTPKAGLLAALAGWLARVPVRLHTFTGQVWVTRSGAMRTLLKTMDRLIARLDQLVLVDSASQRQFLLDEGVVTPEHSIVPASGSISGVDVSRFSPDPAQRSATRKSLGVTDSSVLLLYVGRLNRDKGLLDLVTAFCRLADRHPELQLLIVGPDEEQLQPLIRKQLGRWQNRCYFHGLTREPERFMRAADIFCLPSYREGFGSVIIEAAACGTPAVASRIYGITDAICDGVTGLLHEPGNDQQIAAALEQLLDNETCRRQMGEAACARARSGFSMEHVTAAMMSIYSQLLEESGAPNETSL